MSKIKNYICQAALAAALTGTVILAGPVMAEDPSGDTGSQMEEASGETESQTEEAAAGETAAQTGKETDGNFHSFESQKVDVYLNSTQSYITMPLYFIDGVTDLPYVNLPDWAEIMAEYYHTVGNDGDYALKLEADGPVLQLTRENGYSLIADFDKAELTFDDYDAFMHGSGNSALLDLIQEESGFDTEGETILFQRVEEGSFDRYGRAVTLDLSAYNIDVYWGDGCYLLPLQTAGDFLLTLGTLSNTFYNGEALFLTNGDGLEDPDTGELTELGELYYSARPQPLRSTKLAEYNYLELCMAFDCLYGQKEIHDISNFDQFFYETGYKEELLSTDALTADRALEAVIASLLDDLHSAFTGYSWMAGSQELSDTAGFSTIMFRQAREQFSDARAAASSGISAYEEYGNTAYVTFDAFEDLYNSPDYYNDDIQLALNDLDPETMDTKTLICYAHSRIYRENSPVERVVIDLSNNVGGAIDSGVFVLGWVLGTAPVSIRNSMTGAISTALYNVDVNLDHVFDERDTLLDKKVYCLISPVSFSCGNLVPCVLKTAPNVTLVGKSSGGGSCVVLPMSNAGGAVFQISAPLHLSYAKNGSYYDIDQGAEPDYYIDSIESFYDRERLTDFINSLL